MRVLVTISAICVLLIPIAAAQTTEVSAKPLTDAEIQLARSNVQADKNDIISHTMSAISRQRLTSHSKDISQTIYS